MSAKDKPYITAAIKRFIQQCRENGVSEFCAYQVAGVSINAMENRITRYGMIAVRVEPCPQAGKFHWYFKIEELAAAIGE